MEKSFSSQKTSLNTPRALGPIKSSSFVVPTTATREPSSGGAPLGDAPPQAITSCFLQTGGTQIIEATKVVSNLTTGAEGMETRLPIYYTVSKSPPIGGYLHSFRKDWLQEKYSNNVLNIVTNGYILPG